MATKLQEIYDSLPTIECQGKCQQCCGPIDLFPIERDTIVLKHGMPVTQNHPRVGPITCSKLTINGRCGIYDDRPVICRLFGLVKAMKCPHGCQPSRWLTDKEAHKIMDQIRALQPGSSCCTIAPELAEFVPRQFWGK